MKESDIMHEVGSYWVGRDKAQKAYIVFKIGPTYSTSDSAYAMTPDGLSVSVARCNYLANRRP